MQILFSSSKFRTALAFCYTTVIFTPIYVNFKPIEVSGERTCTYFKLEYMLHTRQCARQSLDQGFHIIFSAIVVSYDKSHHQD